MLACLVAQSCLTLSDPWTVAHQAPLYMGLFRKEYWSVLPFPPPGDLSNLGIKPLSPVSPALQVDSISAEPLDKPQLSSDHCSKGTESFPQCINVASITWGRGWQNRSTEMTC